MVDPLADVVSLLRPRAPFSKRVSGAGQWRVRRTEFGQPFYCVILEGGAQLQVDGQAAFTLEPNDFVLIPSVHGFTMTSLVPPAAHDLCPPPVLLGNGEYRQGDAQAEADVRFLVGHWVFDTPDALLLVSLLPKLVLVRGEPRLATLVQLVGDEARHQRPARDVILQHLLEVLLLEALRSTTSAAAPPGLLRGLADERIAVALRLLHEHPGEAWTVAQLASDSALSRSTFFERFNRTVGIAPMEYLLAWRMALAKRLLGGRQTSVAEVAERVGYSSASTFTAAFTRHVGQSPARFARATAVGIAG